jgi:hypothetical protein
MNRMAVLYDDKKMAVAIISSTGNVNVKMSESYLIENYLCEEETYRFSYICIGCISNAMQQNGYLALIGL